MNHSISFKYETSWRMHRFVLILTMSVFIFSAFINSLTLELKPTIAYSTLPLINERQHQYRNNNNNNNNNTNFENENGQSNGNNEKRIKAFEKFGLKEVTIIDSLMDLPLHLLQKNTQKIYKLTNQPSVIIHRSRLNISLEKIGQLESMGSKRILDWIIITAKQISQSSQNYVVTPYKIDIPLTHCVSNQFGDGGALDMQQTVSLTMKNTLDLTLSLNIILHSESLSIGWELTNLITMREIYTCFVPEMKVGQMWARVEVFETDVDLSIIEVNEEDEDDKNIFQKMKGKVLGKSRKNLLRMKLWKRVEKVRLFLGSGERVGNFIETSLEDKNQNRHIISCVTDERLLDCSRELTKMMSILVT